VKAEQAEHPIFQHYRNYEERPRLQRFRKKLQRRVLDLFCVIYPNRFCDVKDLAQLVCVERDLCALTFWDRFVAAPFMADAEFLLVIKLEQVASVSIEHLADLGNYNIQKALEVDIGGQVSGEPVDDTLTRLMHPPLSLQRKSLLFGGG